MLWEGVQDKAWQAAGTRLYAPLPHSHPASPSLTEQQRYPLGMTSEFLVNSLLLFWVNPEAKEASYGPVFP